MRESVVEAQRQTVLLVRAGARLCGLPVERVVETMRPLPASPLAGAPPFVQGVAIVRGDPVPVVDLATLVGGPGAPQRTTRWVTVRTERRTAALAVGAVVGVLELGPEDARAMPLVRDACGGAIASLRARDDDLLVVLAAARLVPDDAFAALAAWKADA